jgi:phage N-6-adenine-methyltransferase
MSLARFDNALRYRSALDPRQTAISPVYLIAPLIAMLGPIELDPCTIAENPLNAVNFYTAEDDGLKQEWKPGFIYVNPPYGKAREPWISKCIEESRSPEKRIVLLIPAATDTICFQTACANATSLLFLKGRLKFGVLRPNRRQVAASHPSALFGFNVNLSPLRHLGTVVAL